MNIILYKGDFNYGVVNHFVDELKKEFIKKGHNVGIVDLKGVTRVEVGNDSGVEDSSTLYINKNTDLVLGYNVIGAIQDNEIYDKQDILFGALLVDHPFHHYERIKEIKSRKTFFGIIDEGSMETAEKYIDENAIFTHFMHGGSFAKNNNIKKTYDVVVMGGLNNELAGYDNELDKFSNVILRGIRKSLYEKAKENYYRTLDEHLQDIIKSMDIPDEILSMKEFNDALAYIYKLTDLKLRSQIRYNAVLNLLKNNITVHHFGTCVSNVSKELSSYDNFIEHGPVEYESVLEVMAKTKILVHDIGCFKNGSHERVFSAMLNGSLVISNTNNYSFNIYKDGESIVFYDTNNEDELAEKVKYYLDNEEERNRIANNAYEITYKYNTWGNRADEIIEICKAMRNL